MPYQRRFDDWTTIVKRVFAIAHEKEVSIMGASFAHYAFTSILPLLLLVVIGLAMTGRIALLTTSLEQLTGIRAGKFRQLLRITTNNVPARRNAAALALAILLWGAFRLFAAVDNAFTLVYGTRETDSLLRTVVRAGHAFVTIMLAVALLLGVGTTLVFVLDGNNVVVVSLLLFIVLFALFLPMYYFLPKEPISLRDALPGTVITALFWAGSAIVFQLYATISTSVRFYGAIGGLLLFLTWLYLGGVVLILGSILNGVLTDAPGVEEVQSRS